MSTQKWVNENRDKVRKNGRDFYYRHKVRRIAEGAAARKRRKEEFAEFKRALCCNRCPESDPACLDFHHKYGSTKEFKISQALVDGLSMAKIKAEVEKCEVLCANCHRKAHAQMIRRAVVQ